MDRVAGTIVKARGAERIMITAMGMVTPMDMRRRRTGTATTVMATTTTISGRTSWFRVPNYTRSATSGLHVFFALLLNRVEPQFMESRHERAT